LHQGREEHAFFAFVANLRLFLQRVSHRLPALAYMATVAVFLWICSQFYLPGKGFTYLIMFGDQQHARYLPVLRATNHYELENSSGYDAQYYAQLAMQPRLSDPALVTGLDNVEYRARRILFCWTAAGLALGDPVRAMHIYSVQNIVCWFLLAVLLLYWFPAVSWENFFRWFGVLACFGLCFSVRGSLVDGPSLLLIAAGVALAQSGRPWWSAVVLGISGLGKETNLLSGAALAKPAENTVRGWFTVALRGLVMALPLALWLVILARWIGGIGYAGERNFAAPFVAYVAKWQETLIQVVTPGSDPLARMSLLMLVAVTVQFLFFAVRPRWSEIWWRVAAAYSVLMIFLGDAVWEGYPGAASRVLLPMTLAFNILVPRGRKWWLVLLLGNLTVLASYDALRPHLFTDVSIENMLQHARRVQANHARGDIAIRLWLDGYFWFPRAHMGIEQHMLAFFDEPALMHRMNRDLAEYNLKVVDALCTVLTPDMVGFAEDMSYNHGPMLSRAFFEEFLQPYYERTVPELKRRGMKVLVDTDGDVTTMIPWLLASGIEGVYPLERQAGVDIARLRAQHPRLLMMGGYDKLVMSKGEAAMRAEFERLLPVMRTGGYVPSVDHQTPPEVSLENFRIYVRLFREYTERAAR
jgi:hypothetical protein